LSTSTALLAAAGAALASAACGVDGLLVLSTLADSSLTSGLLSAPLSAPPAAATAVGRDG